MSKFFEVKIRVLEQNPKTGRNKFRSETHLILASTEAEAVAKLPEYTFDVVKITLSKVVGVLDISWGNAYLVRILPKRSRVTLFYIHLASTFLEACEGIPETTEIISVVKSNLITESWL